MVTHDWWKELIEERNEWIAHNFPDTPWTDSIIGVIEECGELAHCHLKTSQKIRGAAPELKVSLDEDMRDAIGDMTIYLLGVMNHVHFIPTCSARAKQIEEGEESLPHIDSIMLRLGAAVGKLSRPDRVPTGIDQVVIMLIAYCVKREWDYYEIVEETWSRVKERDWKADPVRGGEITE